VSPEVYVELPEVLTEHFIFGSLEFFSRVNAPILLDKGTYYNWKQDTHLQSAGSKQRKKATALSGLFLYLQPSPDKQEIFSVKKYYSYQDTCFCDEV
jgi:hypothetical protein